MDAPNVIFYGDLSQVKLTRKVRSGIFSSTRVTLGFRYSLCLQFAFCHGPVDALLEVQTNNKVAFSGNITGGTGNDGQDFIVDARTIYGGDSDEQLESGGFGGVYAACTFYKGTDTQNADDYLSGVLGTEIPGHRGVCYLMWKGPSSGNLVYNHDLGDPTIIFTREPFLSGYIGTSPNLTPINFVLRRLPNLLSGSSDTFYNINDGDANPADILVELMTNDEWGMGLATNLINIPSFKYAQEQLHTEGLGFSGIWDSPRQISEVIDEILGYIDGVIYVDLTTGLITIKLARNDYDVNNLLTFDEDSIVEVTDFSRPSWDETTNEVVVSYIDRFQKFKERTAIAQDLANSRIQGDIISTKTSYVGVSNKTTASKIAFRDLRVLSLPLARCTLKLNRKGIVLRPGTPFKVVWPDYGISQLVLRATRIRYGEFDKGQIEVDAVQDVFSLSNSVYGDPQESGWVSSAPSATTPSVLDVIEAPYFFSGDSAKIKVFVHEPVDNQLSFNTYTSVGSSTGTYVQVDSGDTFTPTGTLNHSYSAITDDVDTTNTLTIVPSVPNNLLFLQNFSSDYIKTGENLFLITDGTKQEVCAFESVTLSGNNYVLHNIWRGLLDTVPQNWSSGARLWFFSYGEGYPGQTFTSGATVYTKVESIVSAQKSPLSSPDSINIVARALKPYPPGYFRINGSTSTVNISSGTDITVTWKHRNRVTQGETVVKQFQTDVPDAEARTEYYIKFFNASNTLIKQDTVTGESYTYTNIDQITDNGGTEPKIVTVQLFSRRDGLSSLYPQQRTLVRPTGTVPTPPSYSPPTDSYVQPKPSDAVSINGIKICTNTPSNGQALIYDSAAGCWKPGTVTIPNLSGDVDGAYNATVVTGIQTREVSSALPTANQALIFNGTTNKWEPRNISSSSSGSSVTSNFSNTQETLTVNNTWTDISELNLGVTPVELSSLYCEATLEVAGISPNNENISFRFVMDGSVVSETFTYSRDVFPTNNSKYIFTLHTVFDSVNTSAHSVKVQWQTTTDLDVTVFNRRISTIVCKSSFDANFSPSNVSGLSYWFEADQLTGLSNTNPVNSLLDSSGNARHFAAFSTSSPDTRATYKTNAVNGLPSILFVHDGNNSTNTNSRYDGPSNTFNGFTEMEIFVLIKAANDPASSNLVGNWSTIGSDTSLLQHYPFNDAGVGTVYEGAATNARKNTGNPLINLAAFNVYNISSKNGLYKTRFNGTEFFSTATNTFAITGSPRFGGNSSSFSGAGFSGEIAVILIWNRVLNNSERTAVRNYFTAKYNI